MRNVSALMIWGIVLCALVILLGGCSFFTQPGETAAEGHRRHLRNLSIGRQNVWSDLDRTIYTDEPSKATGMRMPPRIDE